MSGCVTPASARAQARAAAKPPRAGSQPPAASVPRAVPKPLALPAASGSSASGLPPGPPPSPGASIAQPAGPLPAPQPRAQTVLWFRRDEAPVVVEVLAGRQLPGVAAQQLDGEYLHHDGGEVGSRAAVAVRGSGALRHEGVGVPQVLAARRCETLGIEALGIGVDLGGDLGGAEPPQHHPARRHRAALELEALPRL